MPVILVVAVVCLVSLKCAVKMGGLGLLTLLRSDMAAV